MSRSQTYESLLKNLSRLFGAPIDFSLATQRLQRLLEGRGKQALNGHDPSDHWGLLAGVIDQQIIPKLAKAHQQDGITDALCGHRITPEHITHFSDLLIEGNTAAAGQYVRDLSHAGISPACLLLDLVAPAARELGVRWTEDCCSFADVSLGLVRIHEIVHDIGGPDDDLCEQSPNPGKILLSCMPSSNHILGCSIVAEFFKQCAWDARVMLPGDADELIGVIQDEAFDVVGLSVSTDSQLDRLKSLVSGLRAGSKNPHLSVFLGGPVFMLREHNAADFDADAICIDPRMTVTLAEISRLAAH